MKDCVEYYVEGQDAWKTGMTGFFTRWRGIALSILVSLFTMGTPWWWPQSHPLPNYITCAFSKVFIVSVSGMVLLFNSGALYLRRRSRRSLTIKAQLHQLSHYLRDMQTEICKRTIEAELQTNHNDEHMHLCAITDKLCDLIRQYYREITRDFTIEVAIRLAMNNGQQQPTTMVYTTIGRSSGLNQQRSKTSEDIPANKGIAHHFIEKRNCQGVLIYNNIPMAAACGTFQLTKNEELYPGDIKTMMVAPLNAWLEVPPVFWTGS